MALLLFLMTFLVGLLSGCASLVEEPPPDPSRLGLGCTNSIEPGIGTLDWGLTVVVPETIESGKPFTATLDGVAVFDEFYLDTAHVVLPRGLQEVNLVDLRATVHVRSGATGADVTLRLDPTLYPHKCDFDRSDCAPANDVMDDPPDPPGLRGNTDCEPVSKTNPCGRFIPVRTSMECAEGGECASLDKTDQCELHGFCITGGVELQLEEASAQYTAATDKTQVLFGWDDESTGATVQEGGIHDGTWNLPPAVYEEPTGPIGFRATVAGFGAGVECTMGVDSQGPYGVGSPDPLSSPTPNDLLISFPIE